MNGTQGCAERESLVAFLYDDCDEFERRRVERHLETCAVCAADLSGLQRVRVSLATWTPPDTGLGFRITSDSEDRSWRTWRPPVWAQAVAAVFVLAVAAGVANLDVRYGSDGLTVRTGWQSPEGTGRVTPAPAEASALSWRPELTALEQKLRREFALTRSVDPTGLGLSDVPPKPAGTDITTMDPDLLRRVRVIVDESERKQQRELALRVAQLYREMDVQRRSDLQRIEQNFGQIEGQTGAAIAQQREWLNNLVRVSQRR